MSALDQDLRTTLAVVAEEAPHDLGLLSRVHARSQRRSHVRRLAAVTGVVAAAVLVVVAVALLPAGRQSSSVRFTTDPSEFFTSGTSLDLRFPWVVAGLPDGLRQSDAVLGRDGDELSAHWADAGGTLLLGISSGPDDVHGIIDRPTSTLTVGVRGHSGRLDCMPGACELSWQEAPGEWLDVYSYRGGDADASPTVQHVAAALQHQQVLVKQHLLLGAVPRGCLLASAEAHLTMLTGPPVCDRVAASTYHGRVPTGLGGKHVVIAGHPGILLTQPAGLGTVPDRRVLRAELDLGDGRGLEVLVPADEGWNEDLLRYFVQRLTIPAG